MLRSARLYRIPFCSVPRSRFQRLPKVVETVEGRADLDAEVPGWFVCHQLDITKQTLNWWVSSGKLAPVRRDSAGRPWYRYGDVLEAEKLTRRSGRSRRGATMRRCPTVESPVGAGV